MYSRFLVTLQFTCIILMIHYCQTLRLSPVAFLFVSMGMLLGIAAIIYNKKSNFNIRPDLKANARLITTGPYRWVRHPMDLIINNFP